MNAPSKKQILFAVGFLRGAGLSEGYAQIVAERILEPGAQLNESDAAWLAALDRGAQMIGGAMLRGDDPTKGDARERQLGRVLGRAVELLGSKESCWTFGTALAKACAENGVTVARGSREEQALLTVLFQVTSSGRIPGAADA